MRRTEAEQMRQRLSASLQVATRVRFDGPNGYIVVITGSSTEFDRPSKVARYIQSVADAIAADLND